MKQKAVEVRIGTQGRLVLPRELREQLGAEEGATYLAHVDDGRLVLESRDAVLRRLQDRTRQAEGDGVVEELLAERRRAATDEAGA